MDTGFLFQLILFVTFIYSVVLHEVSHGLMAHSMGDTTAKDMGRLTLNPLSHIDLFGSVILPLVLFYSTGLAFGYAKPVPYNPNNLSDKKYGAAKVGFAGPASNLALAVLFGLSLRFLPDVFSSSLVPDLFEGIIWLNLSLAIFNLVPIPPLDGHWLLMTILPSRFVAFRVFLYRYSLLLLFLFVFFGFQFLFPLINFLFYLLTGF